MTRVLRGALLGAVLFAAGMVQAAPLEVYGQLPRIEDVDISDDGTMVALTTTDGEARTVVIRRVADNAVIGAIKAGDRRVTGVSWAGPENVIVTTMQTAAPATVVGPAREYRMALVYNIRTKAQRGLMDRVQGALNVVVSSPVIRVLNGEVYAFVEGLHIVDSRGRTGLFRVRIRDFETKLVAPGLQFTTDWLVGADGEPIAQTEYEQKTGAWRLRLHDGRKWVLADSRTYPVDRPRLGGLGTTGRSALLYVFEDDDTTTMREYTIGSVPRDLFKGGNFEAVFTDPDTHVLAGIGVQASQGIHYSFFDPKADAAWKSVVKTFPSDSLVLQAWSLGFRHVAVMVDSPKLGPALSVIDLDKKTGVWMGNLYNLTEEDISPVRTISYKAADGLPITGTLTLPHDREAKNLPLILLPNTTLWGSTEPGFDWWAQALASRGYAVLRPNPRGTVGLGAPLYEAGIGEMGRKRQTDLSDGVRHLAAQGVIDPKRVCIAGVGYGGYAALAGATLDAGAYRCAASVGGISDLKSRFVPRLPTAPKSNEGTRSLEQFLAVTGPNDPSLARISPVYLADRVAAPVLLIHGKNDLYIPYSESQAMFDALTKAGKPVELVTLEGEDYSLSHSETRLQMLTALVAFLEKHNPPT